jgi:hypothetical protein
MQLADWELAEISKRLTEAEAILAALQQKASKVTAELGLDIIRNALLALDESAVDATRAARTMQTVRLALATLNVPAEVHEHVSSAFGVLGRRQERRHAKWKPHAWPTRGIDSDCSKRSYRVWIRVQD